MREVEARPNDPEAASWKAELSRLSACAIEGKESEVVELRIVLDAKREARDAQGDLLEELSTAEFTLGTLRWWRRGTIAR